MIGPLSGPDLASLIVGLVAVVAANLSRRAAGKAAQQDKRVSYENEAYQRARDFDIKTIRRQDAELAQLRVGMAQLRAENDDLRERVDILRLRLDRM